MYLRKRYLEAGTDSEDGAVHLRTILKAMNDGVRYVSKRMLGSGPSTRTGSGTSKDVSGREYCKLRVCVHPWLLMLLYRPWISSKGSGQQGTRSHLTRCLLRFWTEHGMGLWPNLHTTRMRQSVLRRSRGESACARGVLEAVFWLTITSTPPRPPPVPSQLHLRHARLTARQRWRRPGRVVECCGQLGR